jgi:hypothetical protein
VHLVNKVSRLLQPSVIYIDGGEKPFLKKVPKTDKTDPKRLKKDLPKIVKSISQDDQVGHKNHTYFKYACFHLWTSNTRYTVYLNKLHPVVRTVIAIGTEDYSLAQYVFKLIKPGYMFQLYSHHQAYLQSLVELHMLLNAYAMWDPISEAKKFYSWN